jgi:hypothetical protein
MDTHFLSNEEQEKLIEDYVQRETTLGRKRVRDAETAIIQKMKDMTSAKCECATTGKPRITCQEMLKAIGYRLSDLVISDEEQDVKEEEDDEEDTELGKLSADDEPGWAMGTISKSVQHRMESFRQKQMRFDKCTHLGWGDVANCFRQRDMKYRTFKLTVLAVIKPKIDTTVATPLPTTFGKRVLSIEIVQVQMQMPAVTSRPGSTKMRQDLEKPQLHKFSPVRWVDAVTNSMPIHDSKPVEPISWYPCINHPKLITI